jgi:hypothetical protein
LKFGGSFIVHKKTVGNPPNWAKLKKENQTMYNMCLVYFDQATKQCLLAPYMRAPLSLVLSLGQAQAGLGNQTHPIRFKDLLLLGLYHISIYLEFYLFIKKYLDRDPLPSLFLVHTNLKTIHLQFFFCASYVNYPLYFKLQHVLSCLDIHYCVYYPSLCCCTMVISYVRSQTLCA